MSTAPSLLIPSATERRASSVALSVLGAALCLAVVYFHIKDQNGFPGQKGADSAAYIQIGYYLVEALGALTAVLLLVRSSVAAWLLAAGVAAAPMLGYALSRSTGLPGYTGDVGNWFGDAGKPFTQFVDTASFAVELVLLLLALNVLARLRPRR